MKQFRKLVQKPRLNKSKAKLSAYNGTNIPVKGSCILSVEHKNSRFSVLFLVADIDSLPIIGLQTSMKLNLIKRIMKVDSKSSIPDYLKECSDCFGPIGCLNVPEHHITTDPAVQPVINPPQRIPLSLQDKLYEELKHMVKMKIIEPVQEPTDWVSNIVAVEKPDGTLRICLDPRDLNKAFKRPHYNLPTT